MIDAVDIAREIFVHDSGTREFTGVATLYMRTWPERDTDHMSYRASTVWACSQRLTSPQRLSRTRADASSLYVSAGNTAMPT